MTSTAKRLVRSLSSFGVMRQQGAWRMPLRHRLEINDLSWHENGGSQDSESVRVPFSSNSAIDFIANWAVFDYGSRWERTLAVVIDDLIRRSADLLKRASDMRS